MTTLLAGLVVGAAGSAHCLLMCGPLLAVVQRGRGRRPAAVAAYHAGRLLAYLAVAGAAGAAGQALSAGGLGRALSIVGGTVLLLAALRPACGPFRTVARAWTQWLSRLNARLAVRAAERPVAVRALGGVLNGLLPCGLVYAAALAGSATGSVAGALTFMTGVGLGTLPATLSVAVAAAHMPGWARPALSRLQPAVLVAAGIILIARGALPAGPHGRAHAPAPIAGTAVTAGGGEAHGH